MSLSLFFRKMWNRKAKWVCRYWYQWEEEDIAKKKVCKRVKILCTHLSKWKNETLETIPGLLWGRER
jgi:hypothetical protein